MIVRNGPGLDVGGLIDKENVICIPGNFNWLKKKNEILTFARKWVELGMLSETSRLSTIPYYIQNIKLKLYTCVY